MVTWINMKRVFYLHIHHENTSMTKYLHDISTFQYVPFILLFVSCCNGMKFHYSRYVIIYPHNIFVFSVSGVGILVMDFHTRRLSSAIFGLLRLALHPAASLPTASVSFLFMFLVSVQHPCVQSWLVWIVSGFCKCPQQEGLDWWSREIESDDVHCVVLLLQVNITRGFPFQRRFPFQATDRG